MENAANVGIGVKLDYTEAAAALDKFLLMVAAVESRGDGFAGMAVAMQRAGAEMKQTLTGMQAVSGEIETAAAQAKNLGKAQAAAADEAAAAQAKERAAERSAASEARSASSQQLKDAQYINSTLEQRAAILSRLSAAMTNMSRATGGIGDVDQSKLNASFGQLAQTELKNGMLPALANASAEIERQAQAAKNVAAQVKLAAAYEREMAGQGNVMTAQFLAQQKAQQAAADAYERGVAGQGDKMTAQFLAQQQAQRAASDTYARDMAAQSDKMTAQFLANKAKERAAAETAAYAEEAARNKTAAAYERGVAAQGDKMQTQFLVQQQEAALAAETSRISLLEFQERTLEKQLSTLMKIRALEMSSVGAGTGTISDNAALSTAVSAKYGSGALNSYQAGALASVQAQVEKQAAQTASAVSSVTGGGKNADVSGSVARRAALAAEAAQMRDLNGLARGLAGPSGLLWLTYGSMLPLAGGAALAGGIGKGAKSGGQFQENMAFVKQLSEDSAPSLDVLNTQIQAISDNLLNMGQNGRAGAVQLSESMRTLAQAGYGANDAQQMLPAVQNLSVIGETDPKTAALSIAGTLSAFNLGADRAGQVTDVLSLAAAKSQTDIGQLMESMKQASSVAQDYGSTIEETAAVLELLAKRNITGSAAGTAFRNMLVDLAGRTPKATAALNQLGVSFYDGVTGKARSTTAVLGELIDKLGGYNQQMQNFYGKQIFDERGLKAFSAVTSGGAGNFTATVDQLQASGANGGFAQRQADALNTTPVAEYQKAWNSLETSLIEGFNQSQDSITGFAKAMQNAFKSNDFKGFISDVSMASTAFLDLVRAGGPYLATITKLGVAYGVYRVAMGAGTLATRAWGLAAQQVSTVATAAANAQGAYTAAASMGAPATRALGIAAGSASIGVRSLWAALGPVAAVALAAYTAYELFTQSANKPMNLKLDMDQLRSADNYKYQEVANQYSTMLSQISSMDVSTGQQRVKNMDDVLAKMKAAQQDFAGFSKTVLAQQGQDNDVAKQYLLDKQSELYRGLIDLAQRHYTGSKEDQNKLLTLYSESAQEQKRLADSLADLMADRAADMAASQIRAANDSAEAWFGAKGKIVRYIAEMGRAWADSEAGNDTSKNAPLPVDTQGSTDALNALIDKAKKANAENRVLSQDDKVSLLTYSKAYGNQPGADKAALERAQDVLAVNSGLETSYGRANAKTLTAKQVGTPDNSQKPPNKAGAADRSEYNAAKQVYDLAKDATDQYNEQLKIRKQLNLFISDAQYAQQRDLEIAEENAKYDNDRQKMVLDIAKAEKSGNGDAVKSMQENLDLLDRQHQNKLQNLEIDYEAAKVQRDINKALDNINIAMTARETIMRAINDMYGSAAGFETASLARAAEQATITKAQYEQAKQMEALKDAPDDVKTLATEQRRWQLAQDIYEIEKERSKLLFDTAQTATEQMQSYKDAVDESVAKLKSQQTTFAQASVNGLATGTNSAWQGLFTYIKNPTAYKEANNGQSFGLGTALGTVGGSIFDSISTSLSNSLTTQMMTGIQGALANAGLINKADVAREQAQQNIAVNTATMATSLSVTVPQLLQSIYNVASGGGLNGTAGSNGATNGVTGIAPGTGAALNGSVGGNAGGTAGATADDPLAPITNGANKATGAMTNMAQSGQNSFSLLGMNATQTFGLMYMGMNAFATGGAKAFAKFAAAAIAQLLMVYAIQKLVQSFGGAADGGVAQSMPVNLSDSITMTPLADGGVPKEIPRYAVGAGYVTDQGMVMGSGGPREDKIPTMLSAGEGVLNAKAVDYYGKDTVDAMNKQAVAMPRARKFADGGTLGSSSGGGGAVSGGNQYNIEINVTSGSKDSDKNGGNDKDAAELAKQLEASTLETIRKHSRPGGEVFTTVKNIANGTS